MSPKLKAPAITGDRCPLRTCRGRLTFTTDLLIGRTIIRCPQCERRKAGICRRCVLPVEGTPGKAAYCATHKAEARQLQQRASEARNKEQRLARQRAYDRRPERRERKKQQRREWAARHPERVREHRRRYHLKQTPGYVAGYRRHNARPERQAQKRAQSLQRYYELHPTRPAPVCRICGKPIPFTGTGRPRTQCGGYRDRSCATPQAVAA